MDSEDNDAATFRSDQAASSTVSEMNAHISNDIDTKRVTVKKLIERYFNLLQHGCGKSKCTNINCASSGQVGSMSPNEMAAKAIRLCIENAKFCDVVSTTNSSNTSAATTPGNQDSETTTTSENNASSSTSVNSTTTDDTGDNGITPKGTSAIKNSISSTNGYDYTYDMIIGQDELDYTNFHMFSTAPLHLLNPSYLNEALFLKMLQFCEQSGSFDVVISAIYQIFSCVNKLGCSFRLPSSTGTDPTNSIQNSKINEVLAKEVSELKKEDIRILEGETDKDEDSTHIDEIIQHINIQDNQNMNNKLKKGQYTFVDFEALRRFQNKLRELNLPIIGKCLTDAMREMYQTVMYIQDATIDKMLHSLVISFDLILNSKSEYALEILLPKICELASSLPITAQAHLARIWATHWKDQLSDLVETCQQCISTQVILLNEMVQENPEVIAITKLLKIAFAATIVASEDIPYNSILATLPGTFDKYDSDQDIMCFFADHNPQNFPFELMTLDELLGISLCDCRDDSIVNYDNFYNQLLSENIHMDHDYLAYKNRTRLGNDDTYFTFVLYSFILTPPAKVASLYFDCRIRMFTERNAVNRELRFREGDALVRGYFNLRVRRDFIINDALICLETASRKNPNELKKQLVVEFIGEQGVDEGGVSKEFFHLITEAIFNPDYGMFIQQEETNEIWFNSSGFENEAQFTLIGIIIGLAIYNNVILAVNFPKIVYRKLLGGKGVFRDLKYWSPIIYRSLQELLDYEDPDIEDVFMLTFQIQYKSVFGELLNFELKEDGAAITVGQHNKKEFVDLYSDFLLNNNISRQFEAFKRGFDMVTDESPLKLLFRPEEIELLVCGSQILNFKELELGTEYDGGYTKESAIIQYFWEIVHEFPEESKRKLLEFSTGSDRVPVGGLSDLKLIITRNGSDSDRLPTSHTCFNVLLLPEYNSKEKLKERLLKAITYSKGFGML